MELSRIIGILSFVASILTVSAAYLEQINPFYAVLALGISAGISAFTGRIQGVNQ